MAITIIARVAAPTEIFGVRSAVVPTAHLSVALKFLFGNGWSRDLMKILIMKRIRVLGFHGSVTIERL